MTRARVLRGLVVAIYATVLVAAWVIGAHAESCGTVGGSTVTWNPADKGPAIQLSNGNLTAYDAGSWGVVRATVGRATGKYYFEVLFSSYGSIGPAGPRLMVGIAKGTGVVMDFCGLADCGSTVNALYSYDSAGNLFNGNNVGGATTFAVGDRVGVAVDLTNGKLWFAKNNTWLSGSPAAGTSPTFTPATGTTWYPAVSPAGGSGSTATFMAPLTYTPPTGFSAWQDASYVQCTGRYMCLASNGTSCTVWSESVGDRKTFAQIGLTGASIALPIGFGAGVVLVLAFFGMAGGTVSRAIRSGLGG